MQFKLTFVVAALATLAAATPAPRNEPASSCTTGPVQCCTSTQTSQHRALVGSLSGLIGLTCSPIDILGGGTCSAQAVCCTDNSVGGAISVGCAPVTL
ncbi:fungal hydrophobin [Rhodocollybia butyracea]|uniref:Hydrophobin n=1 Tax=Rhodocollybia butyracea TaxID=206335 RepID=A0A9P5Q968_9AGAR|nr:fungal hydrophobin [Rhodocollybia butyracea]